MALYFLRTPRLLPLALTLTLVSAARADEAPRHPPVESLLVTDVQRDTRLAAWREARFGMFVHWGVYSGLEGYWRGQPQRGYAEHIQRAQKISMADYRREVVAPFNPKNFDADAWVRAARDAGMGYFVITAKHHDGFAMFDSPASPYDIVDATAFARDPMPALREACRKYGVKFGFYYSHAFDWGEENAPGNDWDYANPGGDKLLHGANWWLSDATFLPKARRYVDEKAISPLKLGAKPPARATGSTSMSSIGPPTTNSPSAVSRPPSPRPGSSPIPRARFRWTARLSRSPTPRPTLP